MSNLYDALRGRRLPLRSSTPAPGVIDRSEQLTPTFMRRASTPAPQSHRVNVQPIPALPSRQEIPPLEVGHTEEQLHAGFSILAQLRSVRDGRDHMPVLPIARTSSRSPHSLPNSLPQRPQEDWEKDDPGNDDEPWNPIELWNAARPALLQKGIYIPPSNLWDNWPQAQSWHKSSRVLRVKHRTASNGLDDVYVKAVERGSIELQIIQYLLSPALRDYSVLACPPVMGIIEAPTLPTHSFILTPPLLPVDLEEMKTVGDCLDFVRQALEGLAFLHSQGISHGDLTTKNMMIVPSALGMSPRQVHIRGSRKVHYCYIDFELSAQFRPGEARLLRSGDGPLGAAPEVVNFRRFGGLGYDPFPADVWMLGNVIRFDLIRRRENLDFLEVWAETLEADEATDRPAAEAAVRSFYNLLNDLTREDFEKSTERPWRRPRRRLLYD